jgi:hypothetical protein
MEPIMPGWVARPCLKILALDCHLATPFPPRFRLLQKHDPDRVSAVKEAMELQVEACMKKETKVAAASSSDTSGGESRG